jgi:hypothetical protein
MRQGDTGVFFMRAPGSAFTDNAICDEDTGW